MFNGSDPVQFVAKAPQAYFDDAGIPQKIPFSPNSTKSETLCFRHYNADEVVLGKKMAEWLRFSVVYWHTFRGSGLDPFGGPTLCRPWDDGSESVANAERRLRVAFDFFKRLGNPFWTYHDRDIAPEGKTLEETNANLDRISDLAFSLQKETGVKLLWGTCNLFSHARYMNGAATNPDAHVMAYAGAQLKKGLEVAQKLGAENYVFWGGREGYQSVLNTDLRAEVLHMANFFKMAVAYKKKIGFTGQLLVEPKPKEPTKHQYDYDAMTVIGFLRTFGLENDFKLNIEPNHTTLAGHDYVHDVMVASSMDMLGSIDANRGSPDCGWDTDQFPMNTQDCALIMKTVIEQGGIAPGGLNFDCKVRRESTDLKDMFISHIGAMDTLAKGLKAAAKIIEDKLMSNLLKDRYISFNDSIGKKLGSGECTLEECEAFIKKNGEPKTTSGRQEHVECVFNNYF